MKQRDIAISEAEEKAFQKLYDEEIVGKIDVKSEDQTDPILGYSLNFLPLIMSDINEREKDRITLISSSNAPKFDLPAHNIPTTKSKFEEPRPIAYSQAPSVYPNSRSLAVCNRTLKQLTTIQGMLKKLSSLIASQQELDTFYLRNHHCFLEMCLITHHL